MIGRFRREFEGWTPTVFPVHKAKSLADQSRGSSVRRIRASEQMSILISGAGVLSDTEADHTSTFCAFFQKLDICSRSWAFAGCFEVDYSTERVLVAHWESVDSYQFELTSKALELTQAFPERLVAKYILEMDTNFRTKAVELTRSEKRVPWVLALQAALMESAHLWQELRSLLFSGDQQTRHIEKHGEAVRRAGLANDKFEFMDARRPMATFVPDV